MFHILQKVLITPWPLIPFHFIVAKDKVLNFSEVTSTAACSVMF